VVDDSSFVLGLPCYRWLSFHSYESSLHRVFTWFLLIVCFCFWCLLVFSFAFYFWWMGSHPWFLFTQFFFPSLTTEEPDESLQVSFLQSFTPSWSEKFHLERCPPNTLHTPPRLLHRWKIPPIHKEFAKEPSLSYSSWST
jgi:hypothetical protein